MKLSQQAWERIVNRLSQVDSPESRLAARVIGSALADSQTPIDRRAYVEATRFIKHGMDAWCAAIGVNYEALMEMLYRANNKETGP